MLRALVARPIRDGQPSAGPLFLRHWKEESMKPVHLTLLAGTLASGDGTQAVELLPAVSEINGKVDYAGGVMESAAGHNFSGSITVPVGTHFGFQADALYSHVSDRDFYGGAGHFFWRDPAIGLLGVAGGGVTQDAVSSFQGLIEGQYYVGKFTAGGYVGVGQLSYDIPAPFINSDPTKFLGSVTLDYYVTGNLRLGVGYTYAFQNSLGTVQAEYQTPWKGLALTAEYARGENHYDHALFGLRFYFGKDKPLIDRHRQDDPPSLTQRILTGVGLYGAEFNRKAERYFANTGAPGGWNGGSYGLIITEGPLYGGLKDPVSVLEHSSDQLTPHLYPIDHNLGPTSSAP
jgi:hypothetical protein